MPSQFPYYFHQQGMQEKHPLKWTDSAERQKARYPSSQPSQQRGGGGGGGEGGEGGEGEREEEGGGGEGGGGEGGGLAASAGVGSADPAGPEPFTESSTLTQGSFGQARVKWSSCLQRRHFPLKGKLAALWLSWQMSHSTGWSTTIQQ